MTRSPDPKRRFLVGLGAGAAAGIAGSSLVAQPSVLAAGDARRAGLDVNVRDMGAAGDGVADDTAAFNRATDAAAEWSPALERRIYIPPGTYRLGGTVYVRKGQDVCGAGYATQIDARRVGGSTFVLGRGGGSKGEDPGGAPIRLSGFRALGSAPREPFIKVGAQGFSIENLFLTAVGTGIWIAGADGVINNVIIDQALNGIVFDNAQNILVSGFYTYLANYAVTMGSRCADIAVANSMFVYSRYAGLLLAEGGAHIRGVTFDGCSFVQNAQYETFSGFVQSRASHVDLAFNACQFRNWPGHAVEHGAGSDVTMSFVGCVFDAMATNTTYNQSTTARVLSTGVDGRYRFTGCEFRNLLGEMARVRGGGADLAVNGGFADRCRAPLLLVEDPAAAIRIRDLAGLATGDGTTQRLPSWPGAAWRLTARIVDRHGPTSVEDAIVIDHGSAPPSVRSVVAGGADSGLRVSLSTAPARLLTIAAAQPGARLASLAVSTFA